MNTQSMQWLGFREDLLFQNIIFIVHAMPIDIDIADALLIHPEKYYTLLNTQHRQDAIVFQPTVENYRFFCW